MGKYKQWLHHQEIGRRLRDQINTYEQERARVQKMAPAHPTSLPELENPVIAALLNYTRAGNKLSNIDVINAAMPKMDPDLEQRRPAPSVATVAPSDVTAAIPSVPSDGAVVASLQARAESMSSDASGPASDFATGLEQASSALAPQGPTGSSTSADSVGGWWQRHRSED